MARTAKQFIEEMQLINSNIEIISSYTKAVERVKVRCLRCNKVWEPKAYSLLQGKGCPSCSSKIGATKNKGITGVKSTEKFIKELADIDDSIEVLGHYINSHIKIKLKSHRCNNEWEAMPYSILSGHGCPRCSKSGTSFMEQYIYLSFKYALGENEVFSRDKKTIGMELDIFIPKLNIAIEPGSWNFHKNSFSRDLKKRALCKDKGIKLITIYDLYPKNEEKPFDSDIFTFEEDLNKHDHKIIRNLVVDLFKLANVKYDFSEKEWSDIEDNAYTASKSMTHEIFIEKMKSVNPYIQIIGTYQNSNKRIIVKCKKCDFEWNAVPSNLLSGDGCKKCGTIKAHANMIKSQKRFINDLSILNPNVEVVGSYIGRHSSIEVKCKICGYVWSPIASSLLRGSSHKGSKSIHKNILNLDKSSK